MAYPVKGARYAGEERAQRHRDSGGTVEADENENAVLARREHLRNLRNAAVGTGLGAFMGLPAAPASGGVSIPGGALAGAYIGYGHRRRAGESGDEQTKTDLPPRSKKD